MDKERTMAPETKLLLEQAENARNDFRYGRISREECVARIIPYAQLYNKRAVEIAKEFGMKPKLFSMTSYLR